MKRVSWWRTAACIVATASLGFAAACHPRPAAGHKCSGAGQLVCAAKNQALVCDSNAWVPVPCKGPRGCARPEAAGALEQCDDTVGAEGDVCPGSSPPDFACTEDRAEALVCRDGRFALWRRCRGARGCEVGGGEHEGQGAAEGRNVRCDTSAGAPGDPCERRGSYACSTDAKTMLICTGVALTAASSCRGPGGCHVDLATSKVDCDDTIAEVGDPCDEPRRITCAADHKAELVCTGAKDSRASAGARDAGAEPPEAAPEDAGLSVSRYEKKRECRRSDCSIGGSELFCD